MSPEEFCDKWQDGPMNTAVNCELRRDVMALIASAYERCAKIAETYAKADAADEDGDQGRVPFEIAAKIRESVK